MPILDQFTVPDVITLGQPAQVRVASHATGGGQLSATIDLSPSNDVYFNPGQTKQVAAAPNGTTSITLGRGTGTRSPSSVKLILEVRETGVAATDGDDPLVDIV